MKPVLFTLLLSISLCVKAQRHEILSDGIASLQVMPGDDWMSIPIIELNGDTPIIIAFDDLTHEYHRYSYTLEHCEADWTTSEELLESDFCAGFASGNTIDDSQESLNTNQLYTHYWLEIPNEHCRPRMSGNYRVTVYNENDDSAPVLQACFMVVDPRMTLGLSVTGNTDIDINHSHQQVGMTLDYGQETVTDPMRQIKTVVMQNGRWDNAVTNAKPQFVKSDRLAWEHCRDLIFNGGNEYRKFEMLDVTHTTMGLESIRWDGKKYHAYVWTDEPRPSYVYDEDANGAFLIRNSDNQEADYTCDYLLTHFRLKSPRLNGEVYLNGDWTYDRFSPRYMMTWDESNQEYEADVWLKQGYYSYQYLVMGGDGAFAPVPSEGNFYQTENRYQGLVYYRPNGGRTDLLVAFQESRWK